MEKAHSKDGVIQKHEFPIPQILVCCMDWLPTECIWKNLCCSNHKFGSSKESSVKSTLHQDHRGNYPVDCNSGYLSERTQGRGNELNPGNVHKILKCNHRRRPQGWKIYQSCDTERGNCNFCIYSRRIRSCNYFSLQADETNDVS